MLYSIDINTLTGSITANEKILALCINYDVIRRDPISNVGIESVGSTGQGGFTNQALV